MPGSRSLLCMVTRPLRPLGVAFLGSAVTVSSAGAQTSAAQWVVSTPVTIRDIGPLAESGAGVDAVTLLELHGRYLDRYSEARAPFLEEFRAIFPRAGCVETPQQATRIVAAIRRAWSSMDAATDDLFRSLREAAPEASRADVDRLREEISVGVLLDRGFELQSRWFEYGIGHNSIFHQAARLSRISPAGGAAMRALDPLRPRQRALAEAITTTGLERRVEYAKGMEELGLCGLEISGASNRSIDEDRRAAKEAGLSLDEPYPTPRFRKFSSTMRLLAPSPRLAADSMELFLDGLRAAGDALPPAERVRFRDEALRSEFVNLLLGEDYSSADDRSPPLDPTMAAQQLLSAKLTAEQRAAARPQLAAWRSEVDSILERHARAHIGILRGSGDSDAMIESLRSNIKESRRQLKALERRVCGALAESCDVPWLLLPHEREKHQLADEDAPALAAEDLALTGPRGWFLQSRNSPAVTSPGVPPLFGASAISSDEARRIGRALGIRAADQAILDSLVQRACDDWHARVAPLDSRAQALPDRLLWQLDDPAGSAARCQAWVEERDTARRQLLSISQEISRRFFDDLAAALGDRADPATMERLRASRSAVAPVRFMVTRLGRFPISSVSAASCEITTLIDAAGVGPQESQAAGAALLPWLPSFQAQCDAIVERLLGDFHSYDLATCEAWGADRNDLEAEHSRQEAAEQRSLAQRRECNRLANAWIATEDLAMEAMRAALAPEAAAKLERALRQQRFAMAYWRQDVVLDAADDLRLRAGMLADLAVVSASLQTIDRWFDEFESRTDRGARRAIAIVSRPLPEPASFTEMELQARSVSALLDEDQFISLQAYLRVLWAWQHLLPDEVTRPAPKFQELLPR